jgi:YafQ family addiction module toxin component
LEVVKSVDKIFEKLGKKNPEQLEEINKKIQQMLENPHQFKPLRFPMQHMRRIHIGSFVLIYDIDENRKIVTIRRYEHHDEVYK